jgi:hypothetical protein
MADGRSLAAGVTTDGLIRIKAGLNELVAYLQLAALPPTPSI